MGLLDKAKEAASSAASAANEKVRERRADKADASAGEQALETAASPEPLMTLKGSHIKTNEWRPNRVLIFEDRIEEHDPGFLKKQVQSVRLDQIGQVYQKRGMAWSEVSIESTGGAKIVARGLKKEEADAAKRLLDELMARAKAPQQPLMAPPMPPVPEDIPSQIGKLAGLRDAGVLSEAEFEAKKTELLSRM
jgi:hypothetical protein